MIGITYEVLHANTIYYSSRVGGFRACKQNTQSP